MQNFDLYVRTTRGGTPETIHRVSAAVIGADGELIAAAGDPSLTTYMRSAAKPFQALPLLEDGVAKRFEMTPEELALVCASHNSEESQVAIVRALLERIGCTEEDLACGPHRSLYERFAVKDSRDAASREVRIAPRSPIASNCSAKHAGMLALAVHHEWPISEYHQSGHPVQERARNELSKWTGVAAGEMAEAVDGCGVLTFAIPLRSMALAYARLAASPGVAGRELLGAMVSYPEMVAGRGRLCTELMQAYPGKVVAKVGASGIYCGALLHRKIGIALKVEDGSAVASGVALLAILDRLELSPRPSGQLQQHAHPAVLNTRGELVGRLEAAGDLEFLR